MTLVLSTNGETYANAATISDTPAVSITGNGVTFTNNGRLFGTSDAAAVVSLTGSGGTIDNLSGGLIAAVATSTSAIAIAGSAGADIVKNAGTIQGLVALGDGDDSFTQTFYSSSLTYNLGILDGGAGIDTLNIDGNFSALNFAGPTINFENVTITNSSPNLLAAIHNLVGPAHFTLTSGSQIQLIDSPNPSATLVMQGGTLYLGGSTRLQAITGTDQPNAISLVASTAGGTPIVTSISLGSAADIVQLQYDFAPAEAGPLPTVMDFGGGNDALIFIDRSVHTRTLDLGATTGLEMVWDGGNVGNSVLTLLNGGPSLTMVSFAGRPLTLSGFNAPNAYAMATSGALTLASGSVIGSVLSARPEWGTDYATLPINRYSDASVVNNGSILGDVKFGGGFDLYDGRNGTAGGNISGYAGEDTLWGGAAADRLYGGDQNDTLEGNGGNDVLVGGRDKDTLTGGGGSDTFAYDARGFGIDTIIDFTRGEDRIDLAALGITDLGMLRPFMAQSGSDTVISLQYGGELERITVRNTLAGQLSAADFVVSVQTAGLVLHDTFNADVLFGGPGADSLFGSSGSDVLLGGGGNDYLGGGADHDRLIGGAGADNLFGDTGVDTASYETATVGLTIDVNTPANNTGDAAGDTYSAIESYVGSEFADLMSGTFFAEEFWGGSGDDFLRGWAGNDSLWGGWGLDTLEGGLGADGLHGGDGIDVASYGNASAGVRASLADRAVNTGDAALDTYDSVEGLSGSAFGDDLIGDSNANQLWGAGGADVLWGQVGNDELYGNEGDDWLVGGIGADKIDGGNGVDTVRYSYAAAGLRADLQDFWGNTGDALGDTYFGIENVVGSDYGDFLLGDNGNNEVWGDYGDDHIWGRGGNDVLAGGNGVDTFHFTSGWGADRLLDYKVGGAEKLSFDGIAGLTSFSQLTLTDAAAGLTVSYGGNSILLQGIHTLSEGDCLF